MPTEKKVFVRQAEIFAAYVAYTDHEIGRVIQAVEDLGKLDNTLIIYISGDNGTSAEGSTIGTPFDLAAIQAINMPVEAQLKFYDVLGSDETTPHMSVAWSWAFDTPFKWTKQVASFFGGTRQGMVMSWPGHIKDAGGIRTQFHHIIDIVPTILEATGIQAPETVERHRAETDRRREHGLHVGQGERESASRSARRNTSRCSATARSTTMAGSPPPSLRNPRGSWARPRCPTCSPATNGNSTTSPRTSRRTTTSRRRIPTS